MPDEISSARCARLFERFTLERIRHWGLVPLSELAEFLAEKSRGLLATQADIDAASDIIWRALQSGMFEFRGHSTIWFLNRGIGAVRLTEEFVDSQFNTTLNDDQRQLWRRMFLSRSVAPSTAVVRFLASRDLALPPRFAEHSTNAGRIAAKRKRHLAQIRRVTKPRRGRYPATSTRIENEMRLLLATKGGRAMLEKMKDEELKARFGGAASTCNLVLKKLLSEKPVRNSRETPSAIK